MKKILFISLLFISFTATFSQQKTTPKKKTTTQVKPLEELPDFFTIAYFDSYLGRTSTDIRKVFLKETCSFKHFDKKKLIQYGYGDMYGKGIDIFIREDIINGYLMNTWYIKTLYSEKSNYTKCAVVSWRSNILRFSPLKLELEEAGYTIQDKDILIVGTKTLYCFKKPGRVVTFIVDSWDNEFVVSIGKS